MKVHMALIVRANQRYVLIPICDSLGRTWLKMSDDWKDVSCKRCLKLAPKRKGKKK